MLPERLFDATTDELLEELDERETDLDERDERASLRLSLRSMGEWLA